MKSKLTIAFGLAAAAGLAAAGPLAADRAVPLDPQCQASPNMPLEGRASPLDSASVALADGAVKICYGAPSARGRTMIGGDNVPFGRPWRTGANEPTVLHTTVPLSVGGVRVEPGSYALYTIPGEESFEVFLSRSTERWGIPIDDEVRSQEVGSLTAERERPADHVETLTFRFEEAGSRAATLVMEWEEFRIAIPVTATGP